MKAFFRELARILEQKRLHMERKVYVDLVDEVAALCANTNSDFDRDRFTEACGLGLKYGTLI